MDQAESGEAIMRPLIYDFEDDASLDFSEVSDAFMVGPQILQAPFVEESQALRKVKLPSGTWFDLCSHEFIQGGTELEVQKSQWNTPMYLKAGSILPMSREEKGDHHYCGADVDLHLVCQASESMEMSYEYRFDDGLSLDYQKGQRSSIKISAKAQSGQLEIVTDVLEQGYGLPNFQIFLYDRFDSVVLNGRELELKASSYQWMGTSQTLWTLLM
jgi:alpha-glucosidase (family GH31 glycosyl hydrolase)